MTAYYRLSGGGNDFLALVEPRADPAEGEIRAWCSRGLSLGADGLFVVRRATGAVRMDYFNADGRAAGLCINGTRCAARLAFHLEWARGETQILTGAGGVEARDVGGDRIRLRLPWPIEPPQRLRLTVERESFEGWSVRVGVPHLVLPWRESLERAPVARLGPALRRHPRFGEAGTNVDFVRFPSRGTVEIRTFERGVEAETLACGSGVLAAAVTGLALGRLAPPVEARTLGGFAFTADRDGESAELATWCLTGDARIVSRGTILPAAASLPPSPVWSREALAEEG